MKLEGFKVLGGYDSVICARSIGTYLRYRKIQTAAKMLQERSALWLHSFYSVGTVRKITGVSCSRGQIDDWWDTGGCLMTKPSDGVEIPYLVLSLN